ncbi:MAG: A/G-specific adenine glycosylase [Gallionellaceae bacterium]
MRKFSASIIEWQHNHGRYGLPWQGADAYGVWLSEIMLQQTQVATVIPYYQRFITSFADVAALAAASEDNVLAHWSGLGYYSRARNLHCAAKLIMQRHEGEFPRNFDDIMALPGIGRSTAAAISALVFHERRAILDGNVKRVLARYCAIEGYTGNKKIEAQLWQQAEALLPDSSTLPPGKRDRERIVSDDAIASYTQGLMDLGATICTRTKPSCDACPVQVDCAAYQGGRVAQLPTPQPRKPLPEKYSTFLLLMHGDDILLEKRPGSGIWGALWCPPQFENEQAALDGCARMGITLDRITRHSGEGRNPARLKNKCEALPSFAHAFTHFRLHIAPLLMQVTQKPRHMEESGRAWLDVEDALRAAIPAPVRKLLEKIIGR